MKIRTITAVIADDDSVTRHVLRTLLRQHTIEVIGEASNGKEALLKCAAVAPDVLFLDINMQEMGGFEALDALKQNMPGLRHHDQLGLHCRKREKGARPGRPRLCRQTVLSRKRDRSSHPLHPAACLNARRMPADATSKPVRRPLLAACPIA